MLQSNRIIVRIIFHRCAISTIAESSAGNRTDERRGARRQALGFAIHESLITPQALVNNETKGPPGLIDSDGNSEVEGGEGRNVQFKGKRRTCDVARRLSESLIALSKVRLPRRGTRTSANRHG